MMEFTRKDAMAIVRETIILNTNALALPDINEDAANALARNLVAMYEKLGFIKIKKIEGWGGEFNG